MKVIKDKINRKIMTQESNFYKTGLWDGVMNSIVAFKKHYSRQDLYEYAKEIAPEILRGDSEEFIEKYFPVEYAKEHWVSPNAVHEADKVRIGELFLQSDGQNIESAGIFCGLNWMVCKLGHRRAYVRIMPGHPWHQVLYQRLEHAWRFCAITFSRPHPDGAWILGFTHEWDICLEDMEEEVKSLCKEAFETKP